jgi:uncharacterized protein YjbI with pentapeptide repeats
MKLIITQELLLYYGAFSKCRGMALFLDLYPNGILEVEWTYETQIEMLKTSPLKQFFGWAYWTGIVPIFSMAEATLRGADLGGADLSGTNLSGADLSGADLRLANLTEANLSWASLRWADLTEANLTEANLREADLREADLSGADLSGADLSGADLRWAKGLKEGHS